MKWQDRALCADLVARGVVTGETWFPVGESDEAGALRAKRYCGQCPVIRECLEWAMSVETEGILGGLTKRERTAAKRNDRRAEQRAAQRAAAPDVQRDRPRGTPVPVGTLRDHLQALPLSGPALSALSADVDPSAPIDPSTFADLRSGRRKSVYPATRDRVQAVIDQARAVLAGVGS